MIGQNDKRAHGSPSISIEVSVSHSKEISNWLSFVDASQNECRSSVE